MHYLWIIPVAIGTVLLVDRLMVAWSERVARRVREGRW